MEECRILLSYGRNIMRVTICDDKIDLGYLAAKQGAQNIISTIRDRGTANVVFVTGKSQMEMLANLVKQDIPWDKVNIFHLDEFIGLSKDHPASSSSFLAQNFLKYIPKPLSYHPIDGNTKDLDKTVADMNAHMKDHPLDVAFICIGENGHLAFNDPPADFDTRDPYIVVDLEKRSQRQQVSEGWFSHLEDVPCRAITMSIHEILSARFIVCACPDQRKAKAVAACLYEDITPLSPCSSIRRRKECSLYLDRQSSCLIMGDRRAQ